jgi:transposase
MLDFIIQGATDMSGIIRLSVGLDYHDDSVRVCVMEEDGHVVVNRFVPNDPGAVRDLVSDLGRPRTVIIEACCGAADFAAELIRQTEWNVQLAHPGYVNRMKQGPDKTDCGDAWLLADLGRVQYVPIVWLADEKTRQLRRLVRYREGIKAERKNVKLRIRALLREERVFSSDRNAWTKSWREWLGTVRLGEETRWILDRQLEQLSRLETDLREVEKRMEQATREDAVTQKLLAQEGIGLITAVSLRAAIGRFDRFRSGKQLARFCGVTPCNASSGKRQSDSGLVKAGNRELRATIIQAAKRLPRHVPKWKALRQRIGEKKPANVATAAVANRWLRWLYHQIVAEPAIERMEQQTPA